MARVRDGGGVGGTMQHEGSFGHGTLLCGHCDGDVALHL